MAYTITDITHYYPSKEDNQPHCSIRNVYKAQPTIPPDSRVPIVVSPEEGIQPAILFDYITRQPSQTREHDIKVYLIQSPRLDQCVDVYQPQIIPAKAKRDNYLPKCRHQCKEARIMKNQERKNSTRLD